MDFGAGGEFGLRLAMGEHSSSIYRNLLLEALMIGLVGSVLGTFVGLIPAFYLQVWNQY